MKALLALLALGVAWEAAARAGGVSPLLLPAPSLILGWCLGSLASGEMIGHLAASAGRLLSGVLLGGLAGVALGLAMGLSGRLGTMLDPVLAGLHPLPKLALLPLFLVIFGFGETARILPIALAAFFPMAIAGASAVRGIDPLLRDVARNYGARGAMLLRRVILPGARPMLATGFRLAVNAAVIVTISVEMLTATEGIGAAVWQAWQTMRLEQLYGTLVIVAALGMASQRLSGRQGAAFPRTRNP
ncbi:ABC transporter permease [Falsiroseomonas ponticola]|uniref:ABC transporter permease n=1 Tax=Falsiroseomonas ponticola TaxID=2786951 RepID=UPI001933787D|nr:ABC transporter permease subunit [Roseomonas ponticola]